MIQHSFKIPGKVVPVPELRPTVVNKPHIKAGSDNHRRHIYTSCIKWNDWELGDYVETNVGKYCGYTGYVIAVLGHEDFEQALWMGMKPLFIEVYFPDTNDTDYFHPADLSLKRVAT
jgi:hypothetical protein